MSCCATSCRWLLWVLALSALLATTAAHAWGNHTLLSYRALEGMPEVAQAAPVAVEPLDAFLAAQGSALQQLLQTQEDWARANIRHYRPRPDALAYTPDAAGGPEARRTAFLEAMRLSPTSPFALFMQPDPRAPATGLPDLPPQAVSTVVNAKGATQRFVALAPGQSVSALAVVASATDEPDYGYDINLFDDNPDSSRNSAQLGFGPQPFGNAAVSVSSQAPFHMGFFHQGWVFNTLAPAYARSFALLRIHQYSSLATLAFKTGHAYWGWRFAGMALHYVQDLAQPYHASAAPGSRLPGMLWANVLAKLGFPARRDGLVVLQSNRHFLLEKYQNQLVLAAALSGVDTANEVALRDSSLDARYPAWYPLYARDVIAAEAFAAGPDTDAAIVVGAPARYVMDPAFDFAGQEAGIDLDADMRAQLQAQRAAMQAAIARLLGHVGAHSRVALRGLFSAH